MATSYIDVSSARVLYKVYMKPTAIYSHNYLQFFLCAIERISHVNSCPLHLQHAAQDNLNNTRNMLSPRFFSVTPEKYIFTALDVVGKLTCT
jgi:hypothetical protein